MRSLGGSRLKESREHRDTQYQRGHAQSRAPQPEQHSAASQKDGGVLPAEMGQQIAEPGGLGQKAQCDAQSRRGLISVCTAGGMGVTAVLERA